MIDVHGEQRDLEGVAYHHHPLWVSNRLRGFGLESMVVVGLIHDVGEDVQDGLAKLSLAPVTEDEIQMCRWLTMPEVNRSVEYTHFYLTAYIENQIIASNDVRVILIKMADTLHNSDPERPVGETARDYRRLVRYQSSLKMCLEAYLGHPVRLPSSQFSDLFLKDVADRIEALGRRAADFKVSRAKGHAKGPSL
jgi:hypothetical protein